MEQQVTQEVTIESMIEQLEASTTTEERISRLYDIFDSNMTKTRPFDERSKATLLKYEKELRIMREHNLNDEHFGLKYFDAYIVANVVYDLENETTYQNLIIDSDSPGY
jgi:hypothetical protein